MISNYNGFPTYDLAEKSVNLSKLGRLILLWQYANDCVCEHDLGDINQPKFRVIYEHFTKQVGFTWSNVERSIRMYFERTEQVEAFGKMYKAKIKELLGVA